MRLDIDQSARRKAQEYFGIRDPDYYEYEGHIFFDDAMEENDNGEMEPNKFVQILLSVMDQAATSVHECPMKIPPPFKIPTPYGMYQIHKYIFFFFWGLDYLLVIYFTFCLIFYNLLAKYYINLLFGQTNVIYTSY